MRTFMIYNFSYKNLNFDSYFRVKTRYYCISERESSVSYSYLSFPWGGSGILRTDYKRIRISYQDGHSSLSIRLRVN